MVYFIINLNLGFFWIFDVGSLLIFFFWLFLFKWILINGFVGGWDGLIGSFLKMFCFDKIDNFKKVLLNKFKDFKVILLNLR